MALKAISTAALPLRQWPAPGEWTYEDYLDLPDDGYRYEVIYGDLYMTPAPNINHQRTSGELEYALQRFVKQQDLGLVLHAPCDLILELHAAPVQPDIFFIAKERLDIVAEQSVQGVPDFIVEILSPSDSGYDRDRKFNLYRQAGVPEYWIVDPEKRTIEVFVLSEGTYSLGGRFGAGQAAASKVLVGFSVAVAAVMP